MDKLAYDFRKSLFNDSREVIDDYIECGIDSVIEDGALKEIPIVKSIVSVLKIGKNIYDRNLLKQTLIFINEFNSGNVSKDKYIAYKSTIENNNQKCEEELGRVLILLNNFIDNEKSIMLAKFLKAYINKDITWNEFCEYSEIVNRIFVQDIYTLIKIYNKEIVYNGIDERFRIERLVAVGLIYIDFEGGIYSGQYDDVDNILNDYSRKFVEIIIRV